MWFYCYKFIGANIHVYVTQIYFIKILDLILIVQIYVSFLLYDLILDLIYIFYCNNI